jgi:hypothetical protein
MRALLELQVLLLSPASKAGNFGNVAPHDAVSNPAWMAPLFVVLALLALAGAVSAAHFLAQFVTWPGGLFRWNPQNAPAAGRIISSAAPQRKEGDAELEEVRTRRQRITMLLLMAGFLLLVAYIVGWSNQPFLEDRHHSLLREYLGDVLLAIAMAAMVSFTFSRVLDLPDVSRAIVEKLQGVLGGKEHTQHLREIIGEVVFREGYLDILDESNRLPELRKDIDKRLYGGEARMGEDSLYTFVSDHLMKLYSDPYRRDFIVRINCKLEGSWLIWDEMSSFTFVRNKGTERKGIKGTEECTKGERGCEVNFSIRDQITPSWLEELGNDQPTDLLRKTIEDARLMVGVSSLGFLTYHFNSAEMRLELDQSSPTSQCYAKPPQTIPIVPQPLNKDLVWGYSTELAFPDELKDEPEVKVEWMMKRKKPLRDHVYYLDLRLPTRNVTLVARFPDEIRLEIATFQLLGHHDPSLDDARPKHGYGLGRISDWALPGHGMCLSWYGFDRGKGGGDDSKGMPGKSESSEPNLPNVAGASV